MHPDIHVVLVSDQPTPNLTPALDPELRPREIVLVTSLDKRRQAEWLANALRDYGIRVSRLDIDDAWDMAGVTETLLNWLEVHAQDNLALNATGGTKIMSIAAYESFRAYGKPVFYVHPDQDRLMWILPEGLGSHELADRIKLPGFLLAHGTRIIAQGSELGVPGSLRALTMELIQHIERYQQPMGTLNWAAQTAERRLESKPLAKMQWADPAFTDLVALFENNGFLRRQGDSLIFPDEASRFYANGGWLEAHVWGLCLNLKKEAGIQDILRSLEVERQTRHGAVTNELDVAFLANNRLHLIECKTRKFDPAPGSEDKGAEALYKLDTLTDLLGGLKASAMLVSYRKIRDHDLQRAEDLRIRVCDGLRLKELHAHLRLWIGGR